MSTYYNLRSDQYARISQNSYEAYLQYKKEYDLMSKDNIDPVAELDKLLKVCKLLGMMDDAAVNAVVFQTLALEAYINLAGMLLIGEEEFYKNHEKKHHAEKIKAIESNIGKVFSSELKNKIRGLFIKRNALVHQKPKSFKVEIKEFDYGNLSSNYDDISEIYNDFGFAWSNIEEEMTLYSALQNELTEMRGKGTELIDEICSNLWVDFCI